MKKLFLSFILILFVASGAWATSRTADSCSYTDVKAKYDLSSAGDTIVIPACNDGVTWTTGLAVTIPISIIGNGSTGTSKTKLIADASLNTGIIQINVTSTSLMRVSGIYFDMGSASASDRSGIKVNGTMTQLQIDHNYFYGGKYQINKQGRIFGVIHSNSFVNANASLELDGDNDTSWNDTIQAGSNIGLNTLYVEGNSFIRNSSLPCSSINYHFESSQGGTFVARYNTFDGSTYCAAGTDSDYGIMTHGNGDCAMTLRGHPIVEVYNNSLTGGRVDGVWVFRGGSVLVHDNVTTTTITSNPPVQLVEEEVRNDVFAGCQKTAWPAQDQIFNSFIWNNTANGSAMPVSVSYVNSNCTASGEPYVCCTGAGTGTCDTIIVQDQDYFLHAPAATGGKETLYDSGTSKYTYYDATHKMTFSASGANAYYPYNTFTCPHPLAGSGSCEPSTAGVNGYSLAGSSGLPEITNPIPSGSQPCGDITLGVTTTVDSTCKWDTSITGSSGDTGAVYPASNASVSESPWSNITWTTPGNIYADDGSTANITSPQFDSPKKSYVLKAYNFDLSSIPAGATILGVQAKINAWYRSGQGSGSLDLCQLLDTNGNKVGTNLCSTPVALNTTNTTVITKGDNSTLWGNSLTSTWVKNSNFGIALGVAATQANADVDIDYVTLQVWWSVSSKSYADYTNTFDSDSTPQTTHTSTVSGLTCNQAYTPYAYVLCNDGVNTNSSPTQISFSLQAADTTPPTISNGLPNVQQTCSADPMTISLQVQTNENASCKYKTSDDTYDNMTLSFTTGQGGTAHSQSLSLACGATYDYYVRCVDTAGNKNTSSTNINFEITGYDAPPPAKQEVAAGGKMSLGASAGMRIE